MIGHLHAAQVAEQQMKDPAAPRIRRDEAIVRHARALDAIFACLSRLRESQELARITLMLARKERR
ncbi:hypothetical protein [Tabrizicola flagellatus]|uniref:hypothetical protein n=1 Tax=Tabrizicola flagellatus TaxID=2593021 RepID=UPI0011F1D293|nr:hypothetical protein [Tabrizicola flagellatus]